MKYEKIFDVTIPKGCGFVIPKTIPVRRPRWNTRLCRFLYRHVGVPYKIVRINWKLETKFPAARGEGGER
jgi:hypothetical protein